MKQTTYILLLVFGLFLFPSCNKKKTVPSFQKAVITGFDYRKCGCCGGLLINFSNNTNSFDGEYRLVSNDPVELGIDDSTVFPVYLKVRWEIDRSRCDGNYITIKEFEK
jgi:hypothetical protein